MPPLNSPGNDPVGDDIPIDHHTYETSSEFSDSEDENQHVITSHRSLGPEDDFLEDEDAFEARPQKKRKLDLVRAADLVYPLSQYDGSTQPMEPSTEQEVIMDFVEEIKRQKSESSGGSVNKDYTEFDLDEFCIYLPHSVVHYPGTMTGLQSLATKSANSWYCFDGILRLGLQKRYVQGIPFRKCSIGNYGKEIGSVGDELWIQSDLNSSSDIFYRLKNPSNEYKRYHEGFTWLADLSKHFVDYMEDVSSRGMEVFIHNFRADFVRWLEKIHGNSAAYQTWYSQYNKRDFRCHIAANIEFLWKETNGTSGKLLNHHPVWKEVKSVDFIPMQKLITKATVVTPYVYNCFNHLRFGHHLLKVTPSSQVQFRRKSLGRTLQLTTDVSVTNNQHNLELQDALDKRSIAIGDVLGVPLDDMSTTRWKDEASKWKAADECWYVLVQGVNISKHGRRSFDVIWLYRPSDTTCAKMKYPYNKELFMSDNCSCKTQRITEDEVLCKVSIDWNGSPEDVKSDFFIRQTYLTNNAFVTLKNSHKICVHLRDEVKPALQDVVDKFRVGDTVLVIPPPYPRPRYGLEPAEIIEFVQQGSSGSVKLRRLLRRHTLESNSCARPNELVYSNEECTIPAKNIVRKCFVRFYRLSECQQQTIPAPYNRDGTGDAFYIATRLVGEELKPIHSDLPKSLVEGPDFSSTGTKSKLRGLDAFCGGGNFGRGLEEGGFIHYTHAIDLDANAIHTYRANLQNRNSTKLFLGSVNDMLKDVLEGNPSNSSLIPLPGDIDFISAGSPCPGFSVLNARRDEEKGLRNQSLVASVAAYVDVFRPKYALLENVVNMAQKGKGRDEDVLSQLICCIVGMGYQVQVFNLDAWSFGSPQSRSRLFVSISAPGLEPPPHPNLSHSHPEGTKDRGLGSTASGHAFGERLFSPTPFNYVTAQDATADLPDIGDGRTSHCTAHPDHRMARGIPRRLKAQIEIIPIHPRGMNFVKTLEEGRMTRAERSLFPTVTKGGRPCHSLAPSSKAWERIHPRKLFPTIATSASVSCARTGRCIHWDQQRLITVLETRRAQCFPDDEVLTGLPPKQWKIVGNSVARTVSLALGLSIGEACRKNLLERQIKASYNGIVKEPSPIDADSIGGSFVSAHEEFDQTSTDSPICSEKLYNHTFGKLGLTSPRNNDTALASDKSNSRNEVATQARRRRHNIPSMVTPLWHEKKSSPSDAVWKRDAMSWKTDQSTAVEKGVKIDSRRSLGQMSPNDNKIIHTQQPSWQPKHLKSSRGLPVEKPYLQQGKTLNEDFNKQTSAEFGGCLLAQSAPVKHPSLSKTQQTKQHEEFNSITSYSTPMLKPHAVYHKYETTTRQSPNISQVTNSQNYPRVSSEKRASPILDKDDTDVEGETTDDDSVVFVSETKRKKVQAYVPVDNTMFVAYQRTHETMRMSIKRK